MEGCRKGKTAASALPSAIPSKYFGSMLFVSLFYVFHLFSSFCFFHGFLILHPDSDRGWVLRWTSNTKRWQRAVAAGQACTQSEKVLVGLPALRLLWLICAWIAQRLSWKHSFIRHCASICQLQTFEVYSLQWHFHDQAKLLAGGGFESLVVSTGTFCFI